jgi:hypothetical protein
LLNKGDSLIKTTSRQGDIQMSDNSNNKFEQMLEKLTADDRTGAEALFHEIVVEKSRSIYENLLETDLADIAVEETSTEETPVEEAKKDKEMKKADKEDSKEKEEMKKESTEEVAAETTQEVAPVAVAPVTAEVGGDATDDMIADIEDDKDAEDKGDEKPAAADMEDKIVDLEDAVEELKAEFEKLMSNDGDKDSEGEEKAEKEAVATEVQPNAEVVAPVATAEVAAQPATSEIKSDRERMREYVDKVAVKHTDGSDNAKSPTPKQAKAMGGNAVDFVGSEEKGRPAPKAELNDGGNINTPGASIKLAKAKGPETADKSDNTKSILANKK